MVAGSRLMGVVLEHRGAVVSDEGAFRRSESNGGTLRWQHGSGGHGDADRDERGIDGGGTGNRWRIPCRGLDCREYAGPDAIVCQPSDGQRRFARKPDVNDG